MGMALARKLYYSGKLLLLVLMIVGELIWLPDPLRFGGGTYWIDAIDYAIYVLALVPILWLAGGFIRLWADKRGGARVLLCLLVLVNLCSAILLVTIPKTITYSGGALALSWLLVLADLGVQERQRRKVPRRTLWTFGLSLALLAMLFWPTNYLVTYPGLTLPMNRYAKAGGGETHGQITGVLVFERPAFPIDWVYAKLFKDYSFEIENLGMSISEYNQEVRTEKEDANAAGSAIAFQKVGLGRGITPQGVRITAILKDSQANEVLRPGDVIVSLGGKGIRTVEELSVQMKGVQPGQPVSLTVQRDGASHELSVKTRPSGDDPNRASIGILIANQLHYDIPDTVQYHDYFLHEGGPSHGAMLALTLIDQLTPCGVTYGRHVAGTGTIEPDGSVGAVGGLEQKAYTISRTDADVFFVPESNEADARKGAPALNIVPVRTLDDILNWLKAHPQPGYEAACR